MDTSADLDRDSGVATAAAGRCRASVVAGPAARRQPVVASRAVARAAAAPARATRGARRRDRTALSRAPASVRDPGRHFADVERLRASADLDAPRRTGTR